MVASAFKKHSEWKKENTLLFQDGMLCTRMGNAAMTGTKNPSMSKWLKICSFVTVLPFILLVTVLVVLCLTALRPREPEIVAQRVEVEEVQWPTFPNANLSMSLGLIITVHNPNHGSFWYGKSTAYFRYYGKVVASAPIQEGEIASLSTRNMSTTVVFDGEKLEAVGNFRPDLKSGSLYLATSATMVGRVSFFGLFGMKATGFTGCKVRVFQDHDKLYNCVHQMNF